MQIKFPNPEFIHTLVWVASFNASLLYLNVCWEIFAKYFLYLRYNNKSLWQIKYSDYLWLPFSRFSLQTLSASVKL